ncbi:GDP-mannose 4,6-dehydratase [Cohnella suwonensis]|uniref:GDP-mannose 4,6-dehydratase n=1 Tax=Cohnella suwonensis TaxID=696072 RepID=A0ABW0LU92_9BACL
MSTYLITGGAGFIGSHVCEALYREGHRIINVDQFSDLYDYRLKIMNILESIGSKASFDFTVKSKDLERLSERVNGSRYRLVIADIRNADSLSALFQEEKIDAVVHLAALPGVRASIDQPQLFEAVNVQGTLNILEAMRGFGVRKWVCASSSSVYGNNRKVPFAEEDAVDRPISVYAANKKSCELLGYTYRHLYGIDTLMLRFFTVYGERQRPDLAIRKFATRIDHGLELPFFGDGCTRRDYTYIGDIVNGIRQSIRYVEEHADVYEIVNLGGNRTVSLSELVELLENELGKPAILNRLPLQPGDVHSTWADLTKAQALLGYEPQTSIEEGIRKFIAWYRSDEHGRTVGRRTFI